MPKTLDIYIGSDGEIYTLDGFKLEDVGMGMKELGGTFRTERVSYILPCHTMKRLAFRLIRLFVRNNSSVARWTRKWRGPWQVSRVAQPRRVIFSHMSRDECYAFERRVLRKELEKRHEG